jgi:hypothetical protein
MLGSESQNGNYRQGVEIRTDSITSVGYYYFPKDRKNSHREIYCNCNVNPDVNIGMNIIPSEFAVTGMFFARLSHITKITLSIVPSATQEEANISTPYCNYATSDAPLLYHEGSKSPLLAAP